jgi:mxaL protein
MNIRARLLKALRGEGRLLLPAVALLLLALFLPPLPITRPAYDLVVIFDVTQSMNVPDYELDGRLISRLDYAKYAVAEALRSPRCDTRIGWGVFAGRKIVMLLAPVEVCGNYSALLAALANIDGRMAFENASEVQEGLYWALGNVQQLRPVPDVIFMTDGHEAPPLAPDLARDYDGAKGAVRGWLIGVGDTTLKPIPKTDADGKRIGYWHDTEVLQSANAGGSSHEHLSDLREPHLQQLAKNVGFRYRRLTDARALDDAMHDRALAHPARVLTDLRWLPVSLALLLLAWRFRPDWRSWVGRPKRASATNI